MARNDHGRFTWDYFWLPVASLISYFCSQASIALSGEQYVNYWKWCDNIYRTEQKLLRPSYNPNKFREHCWEGDLRIYKNHTDVRTDKLLNDA